MEVEETVRELPAARIAHQHEAVRGYAVAHTHFLNEAQEQQVAADATVAQEFVAVPVAVAMHVRGKQRRHHDAAMIFSEVRKGVAVRLEGAMRAVDDGQDRAGRLALRNVEAVGVARVDRKSTRLNSSH